jgi:Protein of unknown function (DUF3738)
MTHNFLRHLRFLTVLSTGLGNPVPVVGLSGWMISQRYDIDAKVRDAEVAAMSKLPHLRMMDPSRFMQQSLLADRVQA